jgi:hypothetical protein
VGGFELLIVVIFVLGALYAFGVLPTAGLISAYKRVRLIGLLWAVAILLIAAFRVFDLP